MAPLKPLLLAAMLTVSTAMVLPATSDTSNCTSPTKRKSWHDMAAEDKKAYLAAKLCVMHAPLMALQIHSTGTFLPYHRYFLHAHEILLNDCGYHEGLPYWDEPRDAGKFAWAPVFDATLGFGGDGKGSKSCVATGPFVNVTVNIGPGFKSQSRCISRKITNALSTYCGKTQVVQALNAADHEAAWRPIYSGPHLLGHEALAMINGDSITSSGDPLFMLHHGFVDKMWADWQAINPKRLTEIGGLNA